jgi:hypothetical protein
MFIFFRLSEALTRPGARALKGGTDSACATPEAIRVQFQTAHSWNISYPSWAFISTFFFFCRIHCAATE